jgi:urease accessory protein
MMVLRPVDDLLEVRRPASGSARLAFCRSGSKTVLATAFATNPLRVLAPRNHGEAAWVFLSNLGGGLVDGDRLDVDVDVQEGAAALIGTQASTKVYRSPRGCSQHLRGQVGDEAALAVVPDPVVCFAGAHYEQNTRIKLSPSGSLLIVDGYTSGRSARGERWEFDLYASRTSIERRGAPVFIDATRLDPAVGSIAQRLGRFDVVLSVLAIGPRFASVRRAMLESFEALGPPKRGGSVIAAASPIGHDGALARVAADRFEKASRALHASFAALADVLGDNPFVRKW